MKKNRREERKEIQQGGREKREERKEIQEGGREEVAEEEGEELISAILLKCNNCLNNAPQDVETYTLAGPKIPPFRPSHLVLRVHVCSMLYQLQDYIHAIFFCCEY